MLIAYVRNNDISQRHTLNEILRVSADVEKYCVIRPYLLVVYSTSFSGTSSVYMVKFTFIP